MGKDTNDLDTREEDRHRENHTLKEYEEQLEKETEENYAEDNLPQKSFARRDSNN